MPQTIVVKEQDLQVIIQITDDGDVRLLHCSAFPFDEAQLIAKEQQFIYRLVEVQVTGENREGHHGPKHVGTMPAKRLSYVHHNDYQTQAGRKIEIEMRDPRTDLIVTSHLQFYSGLSLFRSWTVLTNAGSQSLGLEYITSFAYTGIEKGGLQPWDEKMQVYIPHNTWFGEGQWRQHDLSELGLTRVNAHSMKKVSYSNVGSWSTSQYLPMALLFNKEVGQAFFWQIENNGSWHWEISDIENHLYLQLCGPTEQECQWWKDLKPGETFSTVPVAVGCLHTSEETIFEQASAELTRYRRLIRRPNKDDQRLPVIFNDYMNCLFGDPTTEKLLPLIAAAAETGCEYFVIDAGWYTDGPWWGNKGDWRPSQKRFPNGFDEVVEAIRSRGMIPGLWLELEPMHISNPLVNQLPDEWFFCRHGKRVMTNGSHLLDYRNPDVWAYADEIIDRLVKDYGIGYFKMDYNLDIGIGTDRAADSPGDGLLEHNRAYLAWLDGVFERHPDLVIENCSSGGMRMDYALLSRHSIQSSSDQTDYRKNAAIAVACPAAVTPEQSAVWSYPLRTGDREEVIVNMINAMLLRIHQSGHLAELSTERRALVREGITVYKQIRKDIPESVPLWPLGMPEFGDQWLSLGLRCGKTTYLAVWHFESPERSCAFPLHHLKGYEVEVECIYPAKHNSQTAWTPESGVLSVSLPDLNCARLFRITQKDR